MYDDENDGMIADEHDTGTANDGVQYDHNDEGCCMYKEAPRSLDEY